MLECEVSVGAAGERLAGTVCLPSAPGRFPTVLMLHGSGPLDRDENIKGQRLDIFNIIAHRLAEHGVASVRYDKRGCGKSTGDYYRTGHLDMVDDAAAWVDFLSAHELCEPSRIFVLGHSEGCFIAPQLSLARSFIAGLLLLCPSIQNVESTLLEQASRIEQEIDAAPGLSGAVQRTLVKWLGRPFATQTKLVQVIKSSSTDVIRFGFQRVPAKCLRELMALDPKALFSQLTCPLLLLGGEQDLQCDPRDVGRIAAVARGEVEQHVLPKLTHMLRSAEGPQSLLGTAKLLRQPLDPRVLDLVVGWLGKRLAVRRT